MTLVVKADNSMPVNDPQLVSIPLLLLRGKEMPDTEYYALYETTRELANLASLHVKWCVRLPESVPQSAAEPIDIACRFATMSTKCDKPQTQLAEVYHR